MMSLFRACLRLIERTARLSRLTAAVLGLVLVAGCSRSGPEYPLVLQGGRVMDPETLLDAVRDVAIQDGK
jgi:hypothetical protein